MYNTKIYEYIIHNNKIYKITISQIIINIFSIT